MVAITLTSLLLMSLMGVLQATTRQSRMVEAREVVVWPGRVRTMFQRDLLSAETVWLEAGAVCLRTDSPRYGVGGHEDDLLGQGPVIGSETPSGVREVRYRCRSNSGGSLLQRIDGHVTNSLAVGPSRLSVERIDSTGALQPLPPRPGPVPRHVRLTIWQRERIVLRAEVML